jgi:hypothetical protein
MLEANQAVLEAEEILSKNRSTIFSVLMFFILAAPSSMIPQA